MKWGRSEAILRTLLWERHGCPLGVLRTHRGQPIAYCDRCSVDFGLMESQEIYDAFMKLREGARPLK